MQLTFLSTAFTGWYNKEQRCITYTVKSADATKNCCNIANKHTCQTIIVSTKSKHFVGLVFQVVFYFLEYILVYVFAGSPGIMAHTVHKACADALIVSSVLHGNVWSVSLKGTQPCTRKSRKNHPVLMTIATPATGIKPETWWKAGTLPSEVTGQWITSVLLF